MKNKKEFDLDYLKRIINARITFRNNAVKNNIKQKNNIEIRNYEYNLGYGRALLELMDEIKLLED